MFANCSSWRKDFSQFIPHQFPSLSVVMKSKGPYHVPKANLYSVVIKMSDGPKFGSEVGVLRIRQLNSSTLFKLSPVNSNTLKDFSKL